MWHSGNRSVVAAVALAGTCFILGCASSDATRAVTPARTVQVDAVALRVVGGKIAQETLNRLGSSPVRGAAPAASHSSAAILAELRQVADVQVLGSPSVVVTPGELQTMHVGAPPAHDVSEMGFLSGVNTDVRLCFESMPTSAQGWYAFRISGSVLQFTPDKPGGGSANAAYTRLRDFESDLTLRAGQPALVSGPALVEQADGVWTGVVILLTPRAPGGTLASAEPAE